MVPSTKDILDKYGRKIDNQVRDFQQSEDSSLGYSQSYEQFRDSMTPEFNSYERWAKTLGKMFKIDLAEKDRNRLQKSIDIAHLNVTPGEAMVLSISILFLTLFGCSSFFGFKKSFLGC
jgi:hypothetical protein